MAIPASVSLAHRRPIKPGHKSVVVASLLYLNRGTASVDLVFRTRRPLQVAQPVGLTDGNLLVPSNLGGMYVDPHSSWTISAARRCYDVHAELGPHDTLGRRQVAPGARVWVAVGPRGDLFGARLVLRGLRYTYPRGLAIGCGGPADRAVMIDAYSRPWVMPQQWVLSGGGGQYLSDLEWTDWGGRQAQATGMLVSCASCQDTQTVPVQVAMTQPRRLTSAGALCYRRAQLHELTFVPTGWRQFADGC